jgi:glycosyltransferase involved in cell wall biosynthesis
MHLHSAKAGLAGRFVVRGRRATIFQPHAWSFEAVGGVTRRCTLWWERTATRWTHTVICVSDDERRQGLAHGIQAVYRVIPNGVDIDEFDVPTFEERGRARRSAGLPDDQPVTICVGRLTRQKGQDILLTAWEHVRETLPGAVLVLVGDGPERDRLAARAGSGVVFAGEVDDVRSWLDAADLVVAPSRWEGLSLALLEAMATGVSVVASEVNGAAALLPGAGAVVPIEDPDALASELLLRLLRPALRATEGHAARLRVVADFDLGRHVQAVASLSVAVVGAGRGPAQAVARATGSTTTRERSDPDG